MTAHLQATQGSSSHSHRFPDVLQVSSLATFFCSTFEIIDTVLLNGCPRWAAQPGTVALAKPLCAGWQLMAGHGSSPALAPLQL